MGVVNFFPGSKAAGACR